MIFILYIRLRMFCFFKGSCLFLVSYLIIYLHFLVRFFELPNSSSYYISCTDSDFVVSNWFILSSTSALRPLPAVKVSIFPQEI